MTNWSSICISQITWMCWIWLPCKKLMLTFRWYVLRWGYMKKCQKTCLKNVGLFIQRVTNNHHSKKNTHPLYCNIIMSHNNLEIWIHYLRIRFGPNFRLYNSNFVLEKSKFLMLRTSPWGVHATPWAQRGPRSDTQD